MLRDPVAYTAPPIPVGDPVTFVYDPRNVHPEISREESGSFAEITTPFASCTRIGNNNRVLAG